MWHEARKQEKKIRGMLAADRQKRADRRKEYYDRIKADPIRFMQLHGRKYKVNFEATTDASDHMMPWQGDKDTLIDRFDVRAHLDYIPPPKKQEESETDKLTEEERQLNYERYRVLAQNEFLGISEENFLKQIQIEEQFGSADKSESDKGKKKNSQATAAIGYTYEDSTPSSVPFSQQILSIEASTSSTRFEEYAKDYSDDSDIDMDVTIDVKKIGTQQAHDLNNYGKKYGMHTNDLFSFLTRDEDEKISLKVMKEQEADKILSGGRKSRRERRSQREKRILGRPLNSPPSYAAKEEEKPPDDDEEESEKSSRDSKSPSVEKITFITSFGGEDELQPHSKISIPLKKTTSQKNLGNLRKNETFSDLVRRNADKLSHMNQFERSKGSRRSRSVDYRRRRSSRSASRRRYRSRSRSRRRAHYSSRSRSRSRERRRYRIRSSRSYSRSSYSSRDRRRSRSITRRRYRSRRRSDSYRRGDYRRSPSVKYRSTSPEERAYKKSVSRRRSVSRKKSSSHKDSASREKKRSYSSSSSSTTSSSSSSSSTSSSLKSSPEKKKPPPAVVEAVKATQIQPPPPPPPPPMLPQPAMKSKSKSPVGETRSPSISKEIEPVKHESPPPIKRYYGRKRDDESSSSLSIDSDDDDDDDKKIVSNESSTNDAYKVNRSGELKINMSKSTVGPSVNNPREKLKKKMQILLNKQYKADKKAESEKIERQMQQQLERDEELRETAIKMRRRRRELRHKYGGDDGNQDSRTNSESDENETKKKKRKERRSTSSSSDDSSSKRKKKRVKSRSPSVSRYSKKRPSRSPVNRYRKSRSSGRNYRRSRSKSRDYRR